MSEPTDSPETRVTPTPPPFPHAGVLDQALYDYFRRSEKLGWNPYDIVEQENIRQLARPERLSEYQRGAVKTVLFVEDHLPGYLSEYLRIMTDPDVPDDQAIVNRNTLHFTFRWVSEEDRHAHVLERYLVQTGLATQQEIAQDMLRERKQAYIFPYQQLIEGFIYLALQEKATHLYYRALAKDVEEPLLKTILTRMGADEASHGRFFYDILIKSHKGDLDALAEKISAVANDFKMPVQNNLLNYRRQVLGLMRAAPSYRHPDVFTDMMNAVEAASKSFSRDSLQLITPELGRFLERDNTGGREQEPEASR
jgi:hypothetical protein